MVLAPWQWWRSWAERSQVLTLLDSFYIVPEEKREGWLINTEWKWKSWWLWSLLTPFIGGQMILLMPNPGKSSGTLLSHLWYHLGDQGKVDRVTSLHSGKDGNLGWLYCLCWRECGWDPHLFSMVFRLNTSYCLKFFMLPLYFFGWENHFVEI